MTEDRTDINALTLRCVELEIALDMQERLAQERLGELNTETARRVELETKVTSLESALRAARRAARCVA